LKTHKGWGTRTQLQKRSKAGPPSMRASSKTLNPAVIFWNSLPSESLKEYYLGLMDWLNTHVYLAAWLALPVAISVAVFQNRNKGFAEIDWSRILIYIGFLTSLAVVFTPKFDATARAVATTFVFMGLGFLIMDSGRK
jgi:hypothetical protein